MPSSRWQIRTTVEALAGVNANCEATACARSTKKRTASLLRAASSDASCFAAGRTSDGTRHARSPAMPSASRLVARICTRGHARRMWSTSTAQPAITCSQLSRTSSVVRGRRKVMSESVTPCDDSGRRPIVEAIVWGIRSGSASGANSMSHTPW
jgi:hypothetical protein